MSSPSPSIKAKEKQRWRDKLLLSSPKAKEFGDEVSGALVTTLTIVEKSLDGVPVPGLKTAVGGILEIIKAIKKSKSNAEDMDQLSKHLETLMESVINPVKDAKMTDALEARINRLTTDLQQIQLNHEGMSKKGRVRQFLAVHDHADTILGLDRMLNRALQTFMGGGVVQIERRIENVYDAVTATGNDTQAVLDVVSGTGRVIEQHILTQAEQDLLKGLPYVSARYDCVSRTGASTCLENTRTALLEHIFEWIQDSRAAQKIFWLHGLAGTGKSTIAHTVARNLDDKGRLGASFFFSRDEVDRRSPLRVLPTIAHQLAQVSSSFRQNLAKCLDERKDAGDAALPVQMDFLLAKPLRQLSPLPSSMSPLVIIMDALDECSPPEFAKMLLKLIADFVLTTSNIDFKIIITGRPEHHLISVLSIPSARAISHPFVLHDIEESVVQQDIETFLHYELAKVADEFELSGSSTPWPSTDEFKQLVKRCGALFVVASTTIKFLADPISGQPEQQLRELLMGGEEAGTNPYKELDKVYHHVISSAVEHSKDASDPNTIRFRKVVGAIVSVLSPMSATTLGNLIGKDTRYIKAAVNHLRSVIIVPTNILSESEPLRVFHLSFPNYLTERCSDPCFAINPVLQHLRLAIDCLNTLNAFLRTNICELPNPLALNHEVPDLQERLSRVVLPHYRYACQNWAFHLEASSQLPASVISTDFRDDAFTDLNEEAMSALTEFCQKKLILWLEVLVLLGWLDKSISAIKAGMKWVKTNWPSDFSINLLDDVRRMVQRSFSKMKLGGSHVYSSGLAFMPDSALYEQYKSSLQLKVLRGRRAAEDPCLSVMKEHSSSVYSVAFSHDSTQIISSNGNSVCIWDASTGTLIKNLEGHTNYVLSVAFSHDSTQIVSSSNDMTVRIWDAVTGSLIKKLEGHTGSVFSVAFSHDSMQIVSGSTDTTVCTWDVDMGSLIWKLEEHTGFVQSVAFSHDSTHIASGSNDTTVCIWDTDSGSLARKLKGHTDGVMSVAFSHDSTRIVSGSWDSTVCIWDAATGSLTKKLEGHTSHIRSVAFSHDSMQVVSGSDDHSVCVWDASTASLTKRLEGHLDSVMSVEFSHDSTQIISGSCDKTVWVWDAMAIDTGSNNNQLQQHVDGVFCMALSHDETYIASGSVDNTIGIWNLATGSLTEMLQYTSSVISIAFSYGGMQIVSGSSDHTVCIWDIFTGSLKRKLEGHTDTVMSVALSCDDTWIVSGSYDHMVLLWDVQTGSLARRLQEHIFRVLSVTFSHNSAQVLSGSEDMTVCIWDVASGSLIRKLEGHDHYVEAVAFSHNSMHIVSGSYDSAVYIWDAVNGSLISRLRHTGPVYSVEFSGNGLDVAVYDRDGQGSIWRCPDLLHSSSSTQKQLTGTSSADRSSGFILSLECNQIIHISSTGCRTLLCCLPDVPAPVSSCSGVFGIIQKGGKLAFVTASRDFYILDFTSLIDAYIS